MRRLYLLLSVLLLTPVLAGCGFHLRGASHGVFTLPFAEIYLEPSTHKITPKLRQQLAVQKRVTLFDQAEDHLPRLKIVQEEQARDLLTINRAGHVSEYKLSYRASAVLMFPNAEPQTVSVIVHRDFPYSDNSFLGKAQEEQLVWDAMRDEASVLLLYRLAALKAPHAQPSH